MNILLISAYFYPQNRISVLRVGQWAKYWALQGHSVTVLTTRKYPFMGPYGLDTPLPAGVDVIEVPYLPDWIVAPHSGSTPSPEAGASGNVSALRRQVRQWRGHIGSLFDVHDLWIAPARRKGLELMALRQYDAIVSSYSPPAAHMVASRLKAAYPDVAWMADFRDLWADNHIVSARGMFRRVEFALERRSIKGRADLLTTVSQPLADTLQARYPSIPVSVVENGFDPDEFHDWRARINASPKPVLPLRICYAGTLYPGRRDPTPVFDAVNRLIDDGVLDRRHVTLDFYGQNEKELAAILERSNGNRHGVVHAHGFVSRAEALAVQSHSTLLLLLESSEPSARGVMTGKLFEYLVSGVPIMAVGIDQSTAAGAVIQRTGSGFCSSSADEIAQKLADALRHGRFDFYTPDAEQIATYARDRQALDIIQQLEQLKEAQPC